MMIIVDIGRYREPLGKVTLTIYMIGILITATHYHVIDLTCQNNPFLGEADRNQPVRADLSVAQCPVQHYLSSAFIVLLPAEDDGTVIDRTEQLHDDVFGFSPSAVLFFASSRGPPSPVCSL